MLFYEIIKGKPFPSRLYQFFFFFTKLVKDFDNKDKKLLE